MGGIGFDGLRAKTLGTALAACCLGLCAPFVIASAEDVPSNLIGLSFEDLANIDITSVLKMKEPLSSAPAAIYVITHDDIIRSGATNLPDILRLAPNLQVAQASASSYAISSRGFNSTLANKLLVLIDGRTVYSPLYAGVFWDMQGILVENVERVEVISGPGATLWGANAVNGVINIILRKSSDTQGGVLTVGGGNLEQGASLQYGGRLGDQATYRLYAKDANYNDTTTSAGSNAHDGRNAPQGGFRIDWNPQSEVVTLQGDFYRAVERQAGAGDLAATGDDLLARWQHSSGDGSVLQAQVYYDQVRRFTDNGGGGFGVETYDLDIQHSFALGSWNNVVWGGGDRIDQYRIVGNGTLLFLPPSRTLNLANIFAQDTVPIGDAVKLTVGLKLEDDPYSGLAPLPSARLSWQVTDSALLWTAVSRAVRAPTPFDEDLVEKIGQTPFLTGSPDFKSEELIAYELGTRMALSSRASVSLSTFYNSYDDLRSIEFGPPPLFLPLHWGNMMEGNAYGLEAWGNYQVADWWQLSTGLNIQHEHLRFKPGSFGLGGVKQAGDDPNHQASARSSVRFSEDVSWDADLRYVGTLPNPAVASYVELNTRLAWTVSKSLEISLSGFNLLHPHHPEFNEQPIVNEVERSFYLQTQWRF